ncbi:MAG: hypothetical protein H7Y04_03415, partial [Verrucomicrobia bacterium]|nr:hypothetical protein [Cytophagales bacterium]
ITVATIANITAFLVDHRWDGFGFPAEFWAVAMLLMGMLVTLFVVIRTNNIFYGLTVIWGFVGIIAKRYALIETEPFQSVPYTALLGIILITIAIGMKFKAWQSY